MRNLVCWIGAAAIAGCGGGDSADDREPEPAGEGFPPALATQIEAAREDLAGRLGRETAEIGVEHAGFVTWRNGAVGCPEPGMVYTEALVPGYRIVLTAGDDRHHYHGAQGQSPFHCPAERATEPIPGEPDAS